MVYKWCILSQCNSTSKRNPDKVFIPVPRIPARRKIWIKLAGRDPNSIGPNSHVYICEDHFDMEKDIKNYNEYKLKLHDKIILNDNIVPSKLSKYQDVKKNKHEKLHKLGYERLCANGLTVPFKLLLGNKVTCKFCKQKCFNRYVELQHNLKHLKLYIEKLPDLSSFSQISSNENSSNANDIKSDDQKNECMEVEASNVLYDPIDPFKLNNPYEQNDPFKLNDPCEQQFVIENNDPNIPKYVFDPNNSFETNDTTIYENEEEIPLSQLVDVVSSLSPSVNINDSNSMTIIHKATDPQEDIVTISILDNEVDPKVADKNNVSINVTTFCENEEEIPLSQLVDMVSSLSPSVNVNDSNIMTIIDKATDQQEDIATISIFDYEFDHKIADSKNVSEQNNIIIFDPEVDPKVTENNNVSEQNNIIGEISQSDDEVNPKVVEHKNIPDPNNVIGELGNLRRMISSTDINTAGSAFDIFNLNRIEAKLSNYLEKKTSEQVVQTNNDNASNTNQPKIRVKNFAKDINQNSSTKKNNTESVKIPIQSMNESFIEFLIKKNNPKILNDSLDNTANSITDLFTSIFLNRSNDKNQVTVNNKDHAKNLDEAVKRTDTQIPLTVTKPSKIYKKKPGPEPGTEQHKRKPGPKPGAKQNANSDKFTRKNTHKPLNSKEHINNINNMTMQDFLNSRIEKYLPYQPIAPKPRPEHILPKIDQCFSLNTSITVPNQVGSSIQPEPMFQDDSLSQSEPTMYQVDSSHSKLMDQTDSNLEVKVELNINTWNTLPVNQNIIDQSLLHASRPIIMVREDGKEVCEFCYKVFEDEKELAVHKLVHLKIVNFKPPMCINCKEQIIKYTDKVLCKLCDRKLLKSKQYKCWCHCRFSNLAYYEDHIKNGHPSDVENHEFQTQIDPKAKLNNKSVQNHKLPAKVTNKAIRTPAALKIDHSNKLSDKKQQTKSDEKTVREFRKLKRTQVLELCHICAGRAVRRKRNIYRDRVIVKYTIRGDIVLPHAKSCGECDLYTDHLRAVSRSEFRSTKGKKPSQKRKGLNIQNNMIADKISCIQLKILKGTEGK